MKKIYILLFMTLCTLCASAAGEVTPRYLEPEGTFFNPYYQISSSTGNASIPNAYMYMPAAESYLFTSSESGNWTAGSVTATNANSFDAKFAFGSSSNKIPTFTIADSVYQYGGAGNAKNVCVATASDSYMSPGKLYGNGYSNVASLSQINRYESYRVFFFNKPGQVMRISEINFPISANKSGKTVNDIFTSETNLTVAIYNATASGRDANTGKYASRSKGTTTLMAPVSLKKDNYIASSIAYRGMVRYVLPEPIYITGPFVLEFKGCNTLGSSDLAIYAYHDKCASTNCVQFYNNDGDNKSYSSPSNALTAVMAMFPGIMKADALGDEFDIDAAGGTKQLAINTNVKPAEMNIDKPSWINYTISYESDNKFYTNRKVYFNLTAEPNLTGVPRQYTIVLDNHGMKVSYTVKQAALSADITISDAKWATLGLPYAVKIPAGVVAYKATVENNVVTLSKFGEAGDVIPANEGAILYAETAGSYNFVAAEGGVEIGDNALKAAIETYNYTAGENVYYLGLEGEKVVFKHLAEGGSIAAGKAYLLAPTSTAKLDVVFEDMPTGINEIAPVAVKGNGIYNIQGVRVNDNFKGIVIKDGKKYLMK